MSRYIALLQGWATPDPVGIGPRSVQQGLRVVRQSLSPHGIQVRLVAREPRGTMAQIYIPAGLLCEIPAGGHAAPSPPRPDTPGRYGRPDQPPEGRHRPLAGPPNQDGAGVDERQDPGQLPTRIPQRLRDTFPVPPPADLGQRARESMPDEGLEQIAAFDIATSGATSLNDAGGPST